MGRINPPSRVKLFAGMIAGDPDLLRRAEQHLCRAFGALDLRSPDYPFDHTDYYEAEFGSPLVRRFVSFETLVPADRLIEIKRTTNDLETRLTEEVLLDRPGRCVNLDPGYVSLSKLVLASTKDHAHRIYLGRGILAEVTLVFRDGRWQGWPWTYPDFAAPHYHAFFDAVRDRLKARQREERTAADHPTKPQASPKHDEDEV